MATSDWLAHPIVERAANGGIIMIDHAFVVGLAGDSELVLIVSAVSSTVLSQNRILKILLMSY